MSNTCRPVSRVLPGNLKFSNVNANERTSKSITRSLDGMRKFSQRSPGTSRVSQRDAGSGDSEVTTEAGTNPQAGEILAAAGRAKSQIPAQTRVAEGLKDGGPESQRTQPEPTRSMAGVADDLTHFHRMASGVDVHIDHGSTTGVSEESLRVFGERLRGLLKPRPRDTVPGTTRTVILARKINLLLDTNTAETGKVMTFVAVEEAAQKVGYSITRTRWSLLKSGGEQVVPEEILRALAAVFGVDAAYLLHEDSAVPERILLQMNQLRSIRRAEVRDVAVRELACVDPQTLGAILSVLDSPDNVPAPTRSPSVKV